MQKVMNGFFDEIFWRGGAWAKQSRLDFGGDPDHELDPGIFLKESLFTIVIPTRDATFV